MPDQLEADLGELLAEWGDAIVANDAAAIGRFAADGWVIVGGTGPTEKAAFLAAVESGALTHDRFQVEVISAARYGDTAIAVAHVENSGVYRGEAFTVDEWSTEVFIRDGDGWLCVFTALTPRTG